MFTLRLIIGWWACVFSVYAWAAPYVVTLALDPDQPGETIHRHLYGQFIEHLGRGIYEGIWVGENSSIANTAGFRNDVLKALAAIKVPLLRWPGGCFADEYHWRDGIGPRSQRPVRVNTHWGGVEENNAFGTHEFFQLAELLGAETYLSGNLGSGSVQEMAAWIEYITSDSNSSLAQMRRQNGRDKPWQLQYFAIGNEAWGCGGHMTPAYYANLYRHYSTFLKTSQDTKFIASGGAGGNTPTLWTDVLSSKIERQLDAISFHYYTLPNGDWSNKGRALRFGEAEWFSTLVQTMRMDGFIAENIKVLNKNDPEGNIGFYIDEWGTWYDPEVGRNPGFLYQQNTLRDAVVAAVNFNIFHKYAKRVRMSNIAQMVNVLQAMILTNNEQMLLTPTYHLFRMYSVFQDATYLPIQQQANKTYTIGNESLPVVSASAAFGKDGNIYVGLVNLHPAEKVELTLAIKDRALTRASGNILTAKTMDAHNSFEQSNNVVPKRFNVNAKNSQLRFSLPAKSIIVLALH